MDTGANARKLGASMEGIVGTFLCTHSGTGAVCNILEGTLHVCAQFRHTVPMCDFGARNSSVV